MIFSRRFLFFYKTDKMNDITVVFASKKDSSDNDVFINHIKESCGCEVFIIYLHNPDGLSISKIYADIMPMIKTRYAVFIHDDIEFLKNGWGAELMRMFKENEKYGIIGVAGSAEFDERGAWWNYHDIYGQVLHRHDGKSWLTAFSPLLTEDLQEVVVIDGLFIAVDKERLGENFDDELDGFDFYDIAFCLRNFLSKKCKIGVTTKIRIAHNSIGQLRPSWYTNHEIINEKFKEYFPLKIDNTLRNKQEKNGKKENRKS